MSLQPIGSFCISSFISWRGLLKYSVKSGSLILPPWGDPMLDSKVVAWAFSALTSRVVSASSVLKIRMSSSSINYSAILNSLSLQIVLNVLDMSILVIKMAMCCAWVLAAIHLLAYTTLAVLLDFLYALCDWDRCLLILSSVLSMKIFDSIFRITSSKVMGPKFCTGPCVFFGFAVVVE